MVRRSARRNQMSRLRAALRFFWCSLAARRLATVFTPQRRLGNAELAAVGLGFERSLVSAVTCFWPDSGYYSTPSRPQRYKLIQLAPRGQNSESRLVWADPVSSQPFFDQHKTAAKSPDRPGSDGRRPLGQLCSLASVSYTTLAMLRSRCAQTQQTRGISVSSAVPGTNFVVLLKRAREPAARTLFGRPPLVLIIISASRTRRAQVNRAHHQHQQDAARANKPCQAT